MAIGVCLTATDVMVILIFWEKKNLRVFEFVIICLVLITAGCLFTVTVKSQPVLRDVLLGYLPSSDILTNQRAVFISVGIIGATVMPHNLYLHSSIVKHRAAFGAHSLGEIAEIDIADNVTSTSDYQPLRRKKILPDTIKFTNIDSIVALAFALLINSSILIISSANFHNTGQTNITEIEDAYHLIGKVLGQGFAILFATGLLIAGQASTVTGTMAGQIVMEGFLGDKLKVKAWIRRLVTRLLAVIPALICILAYGEGSLNNLLIMSQVILSLQLPFAVWPLIYFTSSKRIMVVKYEGDATSEVGTISDPEGQRKKVNEQCFANSNLVTILACIVGSLVTIFNIVLLTQVALGTS
jgi:manganese transport protein